MEVSHHLSGRLRQRRPASSPLKSWKYQRSVRSSDGVALTLHIRGFIERWMFHAVFHNSGISGISISLHMLLFSFTYRKSCHGNLEMFCFVGNSSIDLVTFWRRESIWKSRNEGFYKSIVLMYKILPKVLASCDMIYIMHSLNCLKHIMLHIYIYI